MKGVSFSEIQHGLSKTLLAFTGREHLFMIVMGGIPGAVAGYGAVLFWRLIAGVAQFGWGNVTGVDGKDLLSMTLAAPLWIKILIPAIGGLLIAIIVYFFAHEAKWHGLPEVMEAPNGSESHYSSWGQRDFPPTPSSKAIQKIYMAMLC